MSRGQTGKEVTEGPGPGLKELKESSVGLGKMNTEIKAKDLVIPAKPIKICRQGRIRLNERLKIKL